MFIILSLVRWLVENVDIKLDDVFGICKLLIEGFLIQIIPIEVVFAISDVVDLTIVQQGTLLVDVVYFLAVLVGLHIGENVIANEAINHILEYAVERAGE